MQQSLDRVLTPLEVESSVNFEMWLKSQNPDIRSESVPVVLQLAADGATIPFIARYRKEATGNLNEVAIQAILEGKEKWDHLIQRQTFILGEIENQKKLTPELKNAILSTFKLELLEDIYLPYKQKRKTKAALAKEGGLEPLADWIWNCGHGTEVPHPGQTLELWAFTFRNDAKEIKDATHAIAGAQDILVERLAEIQELRQMVRTQIFEKGVIHTQKGDKAKAHSKFENYFDYREAIQALLIPQNSHRYLAVKRGWTEEELVLKIAGPLDDPEFEARFLAAFEAAAYSVPDSPGAAVLKKAAQFAYKVYVLPAIENEVHKALREVADQAAIEVFSENVRKLLLSSPLGPKAVLGIDPGIRTGCKLAVVDDSGKYIAGTVIHLNTDDGKEKAKALLVSIIQTGGIGAIAVGNGTAGRETELFVRACMKEHEIAAQVILVNESGASVYSASEAAREEFPDLDITERGAISIARRLQDPLAELVKIDPKSIGVGQYQHDVSAHALKRSLNHVVENCVNQVGVNINTASYHLLAYVSGIGPTLAKSLVEYRGQKGLFQSRADLLNVPRFTKKVFEQAAGFLRIPNSTQTLDNTGVHPENYSKLEAFASRIGKTVADLMGAGVQALKDDAQFREEVGTYTFEDVVRELEKPGRDPREEFTHFEFLENVHEIKDLKPGMICPGIVTNVTNFGAFVDVGVHQDGLVHISQISEKFIKDPKEVVKPGDRVKVRVLEVNVEKNQISFSMKNIIEKSTKPSPIKPVEARIQPARKVMSRADGPGMRRGEHRSTDHRSGERPGDKKNEARVISPIQPRNSQQQKITPRKPKEAFNNPFSGLASLRNMLKPRS